MAVDISRIFYNVFHGFEAYGVDVNWPWHVQWKKETVVLVWSSQLAQVRHHDKYRCGVWMGFQILEMNMNLHFMGFGVRSLQLTHSRNLLMCFKEVLDWLSTVVLCELLLIVPTINRFVINNWDKSVHQTIQHFGLYTKAIIRDSTMSHCSWLRII